MRIPISDKILKFASGQTGRGPEKRAIDIGLLKKLFNGEIPETKFKASMPELSRDVAEMVFCLAGMNTADLFELWKENLHNGILCYHRQKTQKFRRNGAYMEIRIPDRLIPLFEKYKSDNEYLLNFSKRFQDSNCFNVNINKGSNHIADKIGCLIKPCRSSQPAWLFISLKS